MNKLYNKAMDNLPEMKSPVIRIIREFFNDKLKCQRLGHITETRPVKIRREANSFNVVARDYRAEIDYCKRCGKQISEPKNEVYCSWYSGVTMSDEQWDILKEKGYLII